MRKRFNPNILLRFPFNPSKIPFFYGWIILFAGIIGMLSSAPGQTIGVSAFTDYLLEALKLERDELSLYYMIGTAASGFILTYAGIFYDRHGARITGVLAGFFLGLVLITFSKVDVLIYQIFGFTSDNELYIGIILSLLFLFLRFFGQGVLTLVSRNMVMKWFEKNRGFVNMFLGVSISVGFSLAPRFFNDLIEMGSWNSAWMQMGIYSSIIFVVFAFIFFRDNPFQFGLKPDGNWKWAAQRKTIQPSVKQYSLKEARKSYTFWIYNLTLTLHALYLTAFTFHVVSIFKVAGFSREVAVDIFLPIAWVAAVFHITGSWLSDSIRLKYLLVLYLFGLCLSSIGLLYISEGELFKILFILGSGIGSGMFGTLSAVTWPRFYGVKHLGAISGFSQSWTVVGSAVGPYFFSGIFKITGHYDKAILICFVIALGLMLLSLKTREAKPVIS